MEFPFQKHNLHIGIDVDGVLRDFCKALLDIIKSEYPDYMKEDTEPFRHWELEDNFNATKEELQQIYWHDYSNLIMEEGEPFSGAIVEFIEITDWCLENEHKLSIVTSQKQHARHLTLHWLSSYELNPGTVYFEKGKDKWRVPIDFLLDDSPENYEHWVKGRGSDFGFYLQDAPYNRHIKTRNRVYGIKHFQERLKKHLTFN
jgi:uncharacterized HAD superfamily protein